MPLNTKNCMYTFGALAFLSFTSGILLIRSLAFEDFVSRKWLTFAYVAYCLCCMVFLHAFMFYVHLDRKISHGKGLSKNSPKYLDYVVTLLLMVGLLQISFADEWLARHIDRVAGSKTELIGKIRAQAQSHLANDCRKNSLFTPQYCDKLQQITKSVDLASYTQTKLFSDSDFLNHTIAVYSTGPGGATSVKSPIWTYVTNYRAVLEYEGIKSGGQERNVWNWLTLLLLPVIISFRAVKTSLEVFAELS